MEMWRLCIRQTRSTKRFVLLVLALCLLLVLIYSTVPASISQGDKNFYYNGDKRGDFHSQYDEDNDGDMNNVGEDFEDSHGKSNDYYGEEDIDAMTMKRDEKDVPIVIVDQHHEVIPYWYKAVKEKIIAPKGNTLIHIDAHSDMAPPDNVNSIQNFITKNQHQSRISHLPLMQGNDRFIISAIMTGLINRVIWIKPNWAKPKNETSVLVGFIGTTKNRQRQTACLCLRRIRLSAKIRKLNTEYLCQHVSEDLNNLTMIKIPKKTCRKVNYFRWLTVSESRFKTVINANTLKQGRVFIDVDEDFFGVEGGVQAIVNAGISLDNIYVLNDFLTNYFCSNSLKSEIELNRQIKQLFEKLASMNVLDEIKIEKEILTHTSHLLCSKENEDNELDLVASFLKGLSPTSLRILASLTYCNSNSLRLTGHGLDILGAEQSFTLCHGTIFPDDTLNQIFVDTNKGITSRSRDLTTLLKHIFHGVKPGFITIARSLRDGYTPRKQQAFIEKNIIDGIRKVLKARNLRDNLIYDKYLLMGKEGWVA